MPRINVVIAGDAAKLNKALAASERRMRKFASGLKTVGDGIFTAVGVPFIAAGAAGVKAATDFEASMSKIQGLVGITGKELKDLENAALQIGPQMGKSANEASEALFFITSAGLEGQEAIDVLTQSLKASAAGLGETKTIADLATSAMNAYGVENLSAAQATDALVAAVREGKLESTSLAGAMGAVLPIASAMGVQFNEVGAAFAAMSRTGTSADEAATQLKAILTTIAKPANESEQALDKMGLSSVMLQEKLKKDGLLATLQLLNDKFKGNTAATAEVFGNVRALTGVLDLMGKNAAGTAEIFGKMADNAGDTDKAFAAAAETTQFKFNKALAELNTAAIKLGRDLVPMVTSIVNSISDLVGWFSQLDDGTRKAIVNTLKWTTLIAGGASVLGRMISGVANLSRAFRDLGGAKAIAAVVSGFKALTTTGTTANIVVRTLGIGLKTLWVSAIAPLAVAVGTLTASLEGLSRAMTMNNEIGNAARQMFTQNEVVRTLTTGYWKLKESLFGVKEGQEKVEETGTDMNEMLGALNLNIDKASGSLSNLDKVGSELSEEQKKRNEEIKKVYSELASELQFLTKKQLLFGGSLAPDKIKAYEDAIDSLLRMGYSPMSKAIQDLKGEVDALNESLAARVVKTLDVLPTQGDNIGKRDVEGNSLAPQIGNRLTDFGSLNIAGDVPEIKDQNAALERQAELLRQLQNEFEIGRQVGEQFGATLAQLATTGELSMKKLGRAAMVAAAQVVRAKLMQAVASYIADAFAKLGVLGGILAGASAGLVGGLFDAAISKIGGKSIPALAEGGMTTSAGYAMIGDNPSGKEFVIPYEKMGDFARRAMGGSNVNVTGEFRVKGTDLVLVLERQNRLTTAKRGYGINA